MSGAVDSSGEREFTPSALPAPPSGEPPPPPEPREPPAATAGPIRRRPLVPASPTPSRPQGRPAPAPRMPTALRADARLPTTPAADPCPSRCPRRSRNQMLRPAPVDSVRPANSRQRNPRLLYLCDEGIRYGTPRNRPAEDQCEGSQSLSHRTPIPAVANYFRAVGRRPWEAAARLCRWRVCQRRSHRHHAVGKGVQVMLARCLRRDLHYQPRVPRRLKEASPEMAESETRPPIRRALWCGSQTDAALRYFARFASKKAFQIKMSLEA